MQTRLLRRRRGHGRTAAGYVRRGSVITVDQEVAKELLAGGDFEEVRGERLTEVPAGTKPEEPKAKDEPKGEARGEAKDEPKGEAKGKKGE